MTNNQTAPDEAVEKAARAEAERRWIDGNRLGQAADEYKRRAFVDGATWAALSAATPGADEGMRERIEGALQAWAIDHNGGEEDHHTPAWRDATDVVMAVLPCPSSGVVGLRPGLREAVEAVVRGMDRQIKARPRSIPTDEVVLMAGDLAEALDATRPGGDDARVVAAEAEVARLRGDRATLLRQLREAHDALGEARVALSALRERIEDYSAHMAAALPHQRIKCAEVESHLSGLLAELGDAS